MRGFIPVWLVLCAGVAMAAPAYMDDRSTPAAVIRSLYNAVTLHDYPRAWSYFEAQSRPPFEDFARGYADTVQVRVKTGEAMAEGAAGTTYWRVPTVIEARRADGSVAVYAGCYVLSQSNPRLREVPPYDPIAIVKGRMAPVAAGFEDAAGDCSSM